MDDRDASGHMSAERVARELGISRRAVRNMAMSGELETVNEGGATRVLISESSVQRLLAEKRATGGITKIRPGIA